MEEMYVSFLMNNSFNVGSVAANESFGLLCHQILRLLTSIYGAKQVHENMIVTEDQFWECIQNAFTTISSTAGIFKKVRRSLVRRIEACNLAEGRIFEHLLQ